MAKRPGRTRPSRRWGAGRVAFLACLADVRESLAAGWPLTAIYDAHAEDLPMSYTQFSRYVAHYLRAPKPRPAKDGEAGQAEAHTGALEAKQEAETGMSHLRIVRRGATDFDVYASHYLGRLHYGIAKPDGHYCVGSDDQIIAYARAAFALPDVPACVEEQLAPESTNLPAPADG